MASPARWSGLLDRDPGLPLAPLCFLLVQRNVARASTLLEASGLLSAPPTHTHARVLRGPTPPPPDGPQMLEEAPQVAGAVPKGLAVGCPPSQLPSAPGCRAPRTVQGGPRARQTRGPHGTDAWGAGGWSTPPRRLAGVSCMDGTRPRPAPGGGLTAPRNLPCLSRPPWVAWRPPAPSGGRGHSGQDAGVQLGSRSKHPRPPTFPGLQSRGLVRGPPGVWELLTTAPPRPRGLTLHPPGGSACLPGDRQTAFSSVLRATAAPARTE